MKDLIDRYKIPKAHEIMSKDVKVFTPSSSIVEVLKTFNDKGISSAPVVLEDDKKKVVGFITGKDCLNSITNCSFFDDCIDKNVGSIMTKNVVDLDAEMNLFEIESKLKKMSLRYAPVTDKEKNLVGIITRRDLMKAIEKIINETGNYKEKINTPRHATQRDEAREKVLNRTGAFGFKMKTKEEGPHL